MGRPSAREDDYDASPFVPEHGGIRALGAVGARSLLGRTVSITSLRGKAVTSPRLQVPVLITYHPSAALRHPEASGRQQIREAITETLALAIA